MNNFFKEEIKELLYLPTIKSKKKYSIIIEKNIDISENIVTITTPDTSNNDCLSKTKNIQLISNKLLLLEFHINSQNKTELHIKQFNYYKKNNKNFILSNKKYDFNIEIKKDNSGNNNNIDIYSLYDIIVNVFLKDYYYNLYILKNNAIFNEYKNIYKDLMGNEFKNLIYNYLLLIVNNKE